MIVTRLITTPSFAKTLVLGFMGCFFRLHTLRGVFGLGPKPKDREIKFGCSNQWRRQATKAVTCAARAQHSGRSHQLCANTWRWLCDLKAPDCVSLGLKLSSSTQSRWLEEVTGISPYSCSTDGLFVKNKFRNAVNIPWIRVNCFQKDAEISSRRVKSWRPNTWRFLSWDAKCKWKFTQEPLNTN